MTKEISKVKETKTEVAVAGPSYLDRLKTDSASTRGMEGVSSEDISIPFLSLLQNNSPQVDPHNPKYVKGAVAGQIYNNVTQEVILVAEVISVAFKKKLVEWTPRSAGSTGAPVAEYEAYHPIRQTATLTERKLVLPNGNQLVETAYRYIMYRAAATEAYTPSSTTFKQAVLAMDSSDLTSSKRWNSMILSQTVDNEGVSVQLPPMAQIYDAFGDYAKNDAGSWYKWGFTFKKLATEQEYEAANAFYDGIMKGLVKAEVSVEPVIVEEVSSAKVSAY